MKKKGAFIISLMLFFILLISGMSFAEINTDCTSAGYYNPSKLPDAVISFTGVYQSPVGWNTTQIFYYYPTYGTLLENTSVMNTNETVDILIDFTLQPDVTKLYYNATLINSTDGVGTAWECQYITIYAPSTISKILSPIFIILSGFMAVAILVIGFIYMIETKQLDAGNVICLIICDIMIIALIQVFIQTFF